MPKARVLLAKEPEIIYKDLSFDVIGLAIEIHKKLGNTQGEKTYEKGIVSKLRKSGHKADQQVVLKVKLDGEELADLIADIVVDDCIVLELKVVKKITMEMKRKTLNYLRVSGLRLGIIINFGRLKLEFYRVINSHAASNTASHAPSHERI